MDNLYSRSVRFGTIHLSLFALLSFTLANTVMRFTDVTGIVSIFGLFLLAFVLAAVVNNLPVWELVEDPLDKRRQAVYFLKRLLCYPQIYYGREEIAGLAGPIYCTVFSVGKHTPRFFRNKVFGPTAIYSEAREVQQIYQECLNLSKTDFDGEKIGENTDRILDLLKRLEADKPVTFDTAPASKITYRMVYSLGFIVHTMERWVFPPKR